MKGKKKVILTVLCAVLLVVGSVLGTMAYLTSQTATATNTFTVGNVAITLDEAKVNINGEPVDNQNNKVDLTAAPRVTANTYKLMPGHTYVKDPTIHIASGSEDCWLFVKVDNGISAIEDNSSTIASQMEANGWTVIDSDKNVYAYRSTVSAGDNISVFGGFKIAGNADTSTCKSAIINITGYAVQADGFSTATAAWAAAPAWQ